jgi:signal transduction histidine kinase
LKRVLQLMGQVNEEGRNALRGLRTAEDDHRNLEVAFSRMRREFAVDEKTGYRIIANGASRPLRPSIRDDVYRIGREAIVNAFLHAQAKTIEVEVEYASRYLRILVRDDGRGINPQVLQAGREGHWGLAGMRERSESIGARLRLRSRIDAGTEVELTVPGAIAFAGHSPRQRSHWLAWLSREKFETAAGGGKKRG